MATKRTTKKEAGSGKEASSPRTKRKLDSGILFVEATYNNTKVALADNSGNIVTWSTAGSLGFNGAKKGTPFAAAKVGELIGDRATQMGVKEVSVVVSGVGAGRESSIRAFATKGIGIVGIKDQTPVPFNGPKPPKPRRV
jgi:small subunit ribosomal protein S11